jgi:hypothetical protein
MAAEEKKLDSLSSEAQEVMRSLVSAIRAVKLYPPNNPTYTLALKKASEALDLFLENTQDYRLGVQKIYFTYRNTPVGKEGQLNRAVAQDLFSKGVREIVFSSGTTEKELMDLYAALSLPSEELSLKGGISTLLWERGAAHIKVTEAGLEEVVTLKVSGEEDNTQTQAGDLDAAKARKDMAQTGRTLVLGDLRTDPGGFGMGMVELAKQTRSKDESVEDRLFALYNEAGRKIQAEHPGESEDLFEGLAESALALEQPYREKLIAGRLYAELDAELVEEQKPSVIDQAPNELHEIVTGRFSTAWTAKEVTALLKRSSKKKSPPSSPPGAPSAIDAAPIPQDLLDIAREMSEYTPEEMEELKAMSEVGMESDIIEAAVRTLIFLLPLVKKPDHTAPTEKEMKLFSGVVHQLEDMQGYLLKRRDYDLAAFIIRVFKMPVDPAFKTRMAEAVKKTTSRSSLASVIGELKKCVKDSPEYDSAYKYLSAHERETTEILLELLADEPDRAGRDFLMELVKDVGKNQLMLIGEHLSDARWFFVRNIVSILGDTKTDQAIAFLQKVADHKNVRIRQEVIKGLIGIGGVKAAGVLAKFLMDQDEEVQLMAVHGLADLEGIGAREARPLLEFLEKRPLRKKGKLLTIEAIKALAKIGGQDAEIFLARYDRIRWWKSRTLQQDVRAAAQMAAVEINRRLEDGGRAKR